MIKVKALDTYEKKGIKDKELNRIPTAGEEFEVDEKRLDVLLGKNNYNVTFVEVVEDTNPTNDTANNVTDTKDVAKGTNPTDIEQADIKHKPSKKKPE